MTKRVQKSTKKTVKSTLVWKRRKPGRPKKAVSGKQFPLKAKVKLPAKRTRRITELRRGGPLRPPKSRVADLSLRELGGDRAPPLQSPDILPNHGEQIVEGAKYELGLHKPSAFKAHNLPFEYGLTKIVLLIVDPGFIFTYWEVEPRRIEEALEKIGYNSRLTLRFCEPARSFDVEVFERIGNWYLRLNQPEELLTVEIGMKNERGEFFRLASSNTMKLPPQGLAAPGPIRWMIVSPDGEKVITEVEEYTEADLELLKKIMGPYFFELLRRGKFAGLATSSLANVFTEISSIKG